MPQFKKIQDLWHINLFFDFEMSYIVFLKLTHAISCAIIIMYLSFCVIPHRESGPFLQSTREFKFGNQSH